MRGKGKLIEGTGKYAGWQQGTMDYTLQVPQGIS